MKVDELIGSLQTFDLAIGDKAEKNNKSITFVSNVEDKCQVELVIDEVNLTYSINMVKENEDTKVHYQSDNKLERMSEEKVFPT